MYNANKGNYEMREYVAKAPGVFVNKRVRYELQDHNPAKYRWK